MNTSVVYPGSIGIIMDGNGRWAKSRGLPRTAGHSAGAKTFKAALDYFIEIRNARIALNEAENGACKPNSVDGEKKRSGRKLKTIDDEKNVNNNVEAVTFYAFSSENQKRPVAEIKALTKIFGEYLNEIRSISDKNVVLNFAGDVSYFGEELARKAEEAERATENNSGLICNIALNYGGRAEILKAVNEAVKDGVYPITEADLNARLYTKGSPNVDLIIRTGGERRVSNFLSWQLSYAELYFSDTLWPDFDKNEIDLALKDFSERKRNFGKV